MHVSPETMKTVAFVLLILLVAVYMHLSQTPRREPQSLVDVARHRRDTGEPETEDGGGEAGAGSPRVAPKGPKPGGAGG